MNEYSPQGVVARRQAARRASMLVTVAITALLALFLALRAMSGTPGHPGSVVPLSLEAGSTMPASSTSHVYVKIKMYAFSPSALTIAQGTTVTWTNYDQAPHTVTVSKGPVSFASPSLQTGQSFTYTFTTAGTYTYYCAVHPDMTASVKVTPVAGTTPSPTPAPTTTTPTPSMPGMPGMGSGGSSSSSCEGISAAEQQFLLHVYAGHLGESPSQQASDILNADQYAKTHLVLVGSMLQSLIAGTTDAENAFLQHVYAGHLGEGPSQQVSDILNADQYAKTHLVLISKMAQSVVGSC